MEDFKMNKELLIHITDVMIDTMMYESWARKALAWTISCGDDGSIIVNLEYADEFTIPYFKIACIAGKMSEKCHVQLIYKRSIFKIEFSIEPEPDQDENEDNASD